MIEKDLDQFGSFHITMKGIKRLSETKGEYLFSKYFLFNGTVWTGFLSNNDGENMDCGFLRN